MTLGSPAYRKLLPSLASVIVRGQPPSSAVLIDGSGLYIAPKMLGVTGEVELSFSNGHIGHATIVSEDGCTQMVLLRSDYVPRGSVPVIAAVETPPGTSLIVMLGRSAVSARVVSDSKIGLEKPSNRVVPLSEIRLELPEASLGGAPVFTSDGQFVGLLSASLIHTQSAKAGATSAMSSNTLEANLRSRMGPADLTVAYLPAPDVIRLVMEGFASQSHAVDHPSLGVFCRNGVNGALVEEVVPDSAAARIGMREGDLIQAVGEFIIRSKVDFAKVMFKVRAGEKTSIRFDRDGHTLVREATLRGSAD